MCKKIILLVVSILTLAFLGCYTQLRAPGKLEAYETEYEEEELIREPETHYYYYDLDIYKWYDPFLYRHPWWWSYYPYMTVVELYYWDWYWHPYSYWYPYHYYWRWRYYYYDPYYAYDYPVYKKTLKRRDFGRRRWLAEEEQTYSPWVTSSRALTFRRFTKAKADEEKTIEGKKIRRVRRKRIFGEAETEKPKIRRVKKKNTEQRVPATRRREPKKLEKNLTPLIVTPSKPKHETNRRVTAPRVIRRTAPIRTSTPTIRRSLSTTKRSTAPQKSTRSSTTSKSSRRRRK